jgi:hypothetical protein
LHCAISRVARQDVLDYFLDVEIFIPGANAAESFLRTEPAARATSDVISAKERPLRAGKLLEQLAHGGLGIDLGGCVHLELVTYGRGPKPQAGALLRPR